MSKCHVTCTVLSLRISPVHAGVEGGAACAGQGSGSTHPGPTTVHSEAPVGLIPASAMLCFLWNEVKPLLGSNSLNCVGPFSQIQEPLWLSIVATPTSAITAHHAQAFLASAEGRSLKGTQIPSPELYLLVLLPLPPTCLIHPSIALLTTLVGVCVCLGRACFHAWTQALEGMNSLLPQIYLAFFLHYLCLLSTLSFNSN